MLQKKLANIILSSIDGQLQKNYPPPPRVSIDTIKESYRTYWIPK